MPVGDRRSFRAPSGMGCGGECTLVGRSVMSAGFALPRDAGRRPALRFAPSGMGCGGECTLVGRSVMSAGFALPRDAGRRPALLSRASRDGMWWGMHVGRAQRHERWFRAPARCRSETGAPSRPRARCRSAVRGFAARWAGPVGRGAGLKAPTGRTGGVPFRPRPVSSHAQVRSGSVITSTRAGPLLASAVRRASVSCSARSTRMPRPPQRVA